MYIRGAQHVNRAVDGDIVAFELLPEAEWLEKGDDSSKAAPKTVSTKRFSAYLETCLLMQESNRP